MDRRDRERFDEVLEGVIESLPWAIRERFEEIPIIVLDEPTDEILRSLGLIPEDADDRAEMLDELCGMHTGVPLTERSIEDPPDLPGIHIFRRGVLELAGWFDDPEELERQVRITVLHELGHHFGLDEDDLDALGYG